MIILIISISRIYHFSLKYIVSLRLQSNVRLHNFDNRRMVYRIWIFKAKNSCRIMCTSYSQNRSRTEVRRRVNVTKRKRRAYICVRLNLSFSWFSVAWMRNEISSTPYFYIGFFSCSSFLLKNEKNETNTTAFLLFSSISTLICKDKKLTDFGVITNRCEPKARSEFRESKFKQVWIFGTIMSFCHATRPSKHFLRKLGTFGRIRTNSEI